VQNSIDQKDELTLLTLYNLLKANCLFRILVTRSCAWQFASKIGLNNNKQLASRFPVQFCLFICQLPRPGDSEMTFAVF